MTKKYRHVIAHSSGGWSVHRAGASRASRIFSTQADAVRYGKEIARQERTDLYVHRRDGTVEKKDSYADSQLGHKGKRG
jgi:Uncharacterized protein conserved in bacteria (DUF2188)